MRNKTLARHLLIGLAGICLFVGSYGCGKKESSTLYPPIVFKPLLGEITGGTINDNLTVTAIEKMTGHPVSSARVLVHQGETYELVAEELTGPDGVAAFAGKGIIGPVTITITGNDTIAYDTVSFISVNAARVVVPLDRRKSPEKRKTALTFPGLDAGDAKLSVFKNDSPYPDKVIKSGKLEEDPWELTVEGEPLAFSALAMDPGGNTTKFGFTVEPDGPLAAATPAMVNLVRVSSDNVKMCRGSIENPPSNLETPTDGWDPYTRYIFQVFSDGGLAGNVVAGFANLDNSYSYQAFIVKTPGLANQKMEVSAFNRRDAWSEMTTSFSYFTFETAPESMDFAFMKAPKNLQMEKVENQLLPDLIWYSPEGNFKQVEVYHADYNFRWILYVYGESTNRVTLPPLELGTQGSLIANEIYRFRVISWEVPGLDYGNMSFQGLNEKVTRRGRSSMVQFMVTAQELAEK